ncbi:hypothetical protein [Luteimonas sp. A478]
MMRLLAAALTAAIVLGYFALMRMAPDVFGWMYPRGGLPILTFSLLAANAALWAAARFDFTLERKFQLVVAAWIWLLVQGGAMAWMCIWASGP